TGCRSNGSLELFKTFERLLKKYRLSRDIELKMSGCHGFCQIGPLVVVEPGEILYAQAGLGRMEHDVDQIIKKTLKAGQLVDRLLYRDPNTNEPVPVYHDIPFYANQQRIALRLNGKIDPFSIEDYLAHGGYRGLAKALEMDPEDIVEEITRSGLRGRGGGGFPTGMKWRFCREAGGDRRYIICNADEGDPGAFMDRSIMEGNPHGVLEGMVLGAMAMARGKSPVEGYIYVRAEYPLAVQSVKKAIDDARACGLLGENIMGSDFSFDVKIKEGAGAFVCGEETALMTSIEGRRGMPRQRPPFPAQEGLWGKPSNINNVETWINIPEIIVRGWEWYGAIGTEKSKGTKVFSLVGNVKNSGLVEVPMGISLKDIIFKIGGGLIGDRKFKAAQTGGPSGGCIPAKYMEIPIDYERLAEVGSIMGSGGLVVMDEETCMVDVARYFLTFTQSESCGKCTPCRLGTREMLTILNEICAGKGKAGDIELLKEIGGMTRKASLCGLGQTAANPVLTTIKYFENEYEEHIRDKKCRAVVCQGIVGAPCRHTCPAGVDVPRYVRLIEKGDFVSARKVVQEKLPFAWACGLVCFHPCESRCRRGPMDEPLAVRALKRSALEYGGGVIGDGKMVVGESGRKIAIVGSGPAGLTAAYYLRKFGGHAVDVFEALPDAGGMLRYGIPEYRLPRKVLNAEIKRIERLGVRIRTGRRIGGIGKLRKSYDAVFVGAGASENVSLGIPGDGMKGMLSCLEFLRDVKMGAEPKVGPEVAVIGGGNSAIDAARTALRAGAAGVTILYRRTEKEMPASEEEIEEARAEGVRMEFLVAPLKAVRKKGRIRLTLGNMMLGDYDASGRRRPVPAPGSEVDMEFDHVIAAIGQRPAVAGIGVELGRGGRITVDGATLETSMRGVYAGGDVVLGPSSVIEAIAQGRQAAASIDLYLGGTGKIVEKLVEEKLGSQKLPRAEEKGERKRPAMRFLSARRRVECFDQVECGFSRKQAMQEASRCLQCDLEEE
ncbi:MAG: NADH-ubiquinone oxidoreductase-F iron-sulfur binding region domain-containing protein, partial [Pseudomonadota bacterium]